MSTGFVEIVRELVRLNHQAAEDEYLDTGEVIALADRAEQLLRQHEGEERAGTDTLTAFAFDTSKLEWERIGPEADPAMHLNATVSIYGVFHHLEAREAEFDEAFDGLHDAFGADGPFHTVEIAGRQYALFMSPFCR